MANTSNSHNHRSSEAPDSQPAIRLAEFDQYRSLLFSIAYRMLGSVADAEDMLQETFLRWQQMPAREVQSPRAFLVTIISRLCINQLQSARVQREEYLGPWLPEPLVISPDHDPSHIIRIDESLSLAFLVLLERLTPVERAVFLLREVFEYEYTEISAMLSLSAANCRQIFARARRHIAAMRPRFQPSEEKKNDLLDRFLRATSGDGDMQGLLALLAEDVTLYADGGGKGPGVPNQVHGADRVARGMLAGLRKFVPANLVRRVVQVNGEPGVVAYLDAKPFSVVTVESRGGFISAIYVLTNPDKLAHIPNLGEK